MRQVPEVEDPSDSDFIVPLLSQAQESSTPAELREGLQFQEGKNPVDYYPNREPLEQHRNKGK